MNGTEDAQVLYSYVGENAYISLPQHEKVGSKAPIGLKQYRVMFGNIIKQVDGLAGFTLHESGPGWSFTLPCQWQDSRHHQQHRREEQTPLCFRHLSCALSGH